MSITFRVTPVLVVCTTASTHSGSTKLRYTPSRAARCSGESRGSVRMASSAPPTSRRLSGAGCPAPRQELLGRQLQGGRDRVEHLQRGLVQPALHLTEVGVGDTGHRGHLAQRQVGQLALGADELAQGVHLDGPARGRSAVVRRARGGRRVIGRARGRLVCGGSCSGHASIIPVRRPAWVRCSPIDHPTHRLRGVLSATHGRSRP